MIDGIFTGKKLADSFNPRTADWKNARRIVNGLDHADGIATYAKKVYAAIGYTTNERRTGSTRRQSAEPHFASSP